MIYLLIFITIYILSAWRAWWWIRMAYYHPKGKWNNNTPIDGDYYTTFLPILNTITAITLLFVSWKREQNNDNIFKPKKPLI